MKLLYLALAVLTCPLSIAQESSTTIPESVQRYMDSRSMVIGWLDASKIDLDALGQFAVKLRGEGPPMDHAKAMRDALVQLGVRRIYWISDLAGLHNGPQAVVVPVSVEKQEIVATLMKAFISDTNGTAVAKNGIVLAGQTDAVRQLQNEKSGPANADLLMAANRVMDPHGLVVLTPVQTVLPFVGMLPKLANGDTERVTRAAEYLVNLRSVTLSGELPPSKAMLRVSTKSKETAEGLSGLLNTWTTEQMPELSSALQLKTEAEDIVLKSETIDQAISIFSAVQQLVMGNSQPDTMNSLKQIALAMHNFHDVHSHFPPQALADGSGRRTLSWRVLILPWLDQAPLYNEFHLDEPWDSEHNLKLVAKMPAVFKTRSLSGDPLEAGKTRFVAPLTRNSVFGRVGPGTRIQEITDGTSNTLMVVEVDADKAVIWTKPDDLPINEEDPLGSIVGPETKTFAACLCDGSARIFPRMIPMAALKGLLSMNGGEIIDLSNLE